SAYVDSQVAGAQIRGKFDVTLLPLGTLGRWGLAGLRVLSHLTEAVELVRFVTRKNAPGERARVLSAPPTPPELYNFPAISEPHPRFQLLGQAFRSGIVARPSNVSGKKYQEVSEAYFRAVNSVLTRKIRASQAAAALENELVRITGFKKGHPMGSARP